MKNSNPALSYQQMAVRGATALGQVVSLYDTILRDFTRALSALQAGDIETRVFELNHALLVIAHLQSVLDHDRGGEAAKRLDQFYNVTRGLIVQASIRSSSDDLETLVRLYSEMRQAWQQIERELPAGRGAEPRQTTHSTPVEMREAQPADEEDSSTRLRWSA